MDELVNEGAVTEEGAAPQEPQQTGQEPQQTAPPVESAEPAEPPRPILPTWLDGPLSDQQPQPQSHQSPAPYPPMYPPPQEGQPHPGPQAPQPSQPQDNPLEQFVNNPNGYIESIAEKRAREIAEQQVGPLYQAQQSMFRAQALSADSEAQGAIRQAYERVYNADPAFSNNPQVQKTLEETLKICHTNARQRALRGDFSALRQLSNPDFHAMALHMAKFGIPMTAPEPVQPDPVAGSSPAAPTDSPEVPEDVKSALRHLPPDQQEEYLKAYMEEMANPTGDFIL